MVIVISEREGIFGKLSLFTDATCISPLTGQGNFRLRSHEIDGAMLNEADRKNWSVDYPDVEHSSIACLLCLGVETYGRWSSHWLRLVRELARFRSRDINDNFRKSEQNTFESRWWGLLNTVIQRAIGETALYHSDDLLTNEEWDSLPNLVDVLDFERIWFHPPWAADFFLPLLAIL